MNFDLTRLASKRVSRQCRYTPAPYFFLRRFQLRPKGIILQTNPLQQVLPNRLEIVQIAAQEQREAIVVLLRKTVIYKECYSKGGPFESSCSEASNVRLRDRCTYFYWFTSLNP